MGNRTETFWAADLQVEEREREVFIIWDINIQHTISGRGGILKTTVCYIKNY